MEENGNFNDEFDKQEMENRADETPKIMPPESETLTPAPRKKKVWKRVGSVALAIALFGAGYAASALQYDSEMRTLSRIKMAIQSNYYEEVTDDEFYGVLFDAINEELLDKYSQYMNPDEYAEMTTEATGEWSGLGLTFLTEGENGEKQMLIRRVSGNSPAEKLGIVEGDFVIGYGLTEESLTLSNDYDEFYAFVQERAKGEEFALKIRRGANESVVKIAKDTFIENYVFYRTNEAAYSFTGGNATQMTSVNDPLPALGGDTAYIRLTQFNGNAAQEFATAMGKFKEEGKKNLVLDLRENGGGYMNILQEICSYFCKGESKKALVAVAQYREGQKEEFYSTKGLYSQYFAEDSQIKVLADDGTASASECLLGCMLDYGAIGYEDICLIERGGVAKTYGKGIMQSTFPFGLGNTDAIKLTTAKILWPKSGNCIHGRGILPEDGAKSVKYNYEKDGEITAALGVLF